MSQSNKKQRRLGNKDEIHEKQKKKKNLVISGFFLFLMVFAVAGWAMMSGGGYTSPDSENLPKNYPLTQVELEDGSYLWYTIKNHEQFYFEELDSFQGDLGAQGLSSKLLNQTTLSIHEDGEGLAEASYLLQKALRANEIAYTLSSNLECANPTQVVLTTNVSLEGDCTKVFLSQENSFKDMESLVYHLVKE